MEYCKLQVGGLLILLYIAFCYCRERSKMKLEYKNIRFDGLLMLSIVYIIFDGLTAYFVNCPAMIDSTLNRIFHLFFLLSLDAFIFSSFLYLVSITEGIPQKKGKLVALWSPFVFNILVVIFHIDSLEYRHGEISNYSMGESVYTCFVMVGIYLLLSFITFFRRWNYMESQKRISIFTYLMVLLCVAGYQALNPQSLISSIGIVVIVVGIYINLENPALKKLHYYHSEMVMGFATLVENKDDSTGGHIRRTTEYVKLLSGELRKRGIYKNILTKDYINNLLLAAPMHDIGKISIPDAILQKPGKLTDEEFSEMKKHAANGGRIIQDTFGHLGEEQYGRMAYEVARFHHEKWNGKGYPEGLKRREIPLSARIMAIADVFDAVSQTRCYRPAMPLQKCFEIIEEGSGQDFEPILVDVFLDIREQVEQVHHQINDKNGHKL